MPEWVGTVVFLLAVGLTATKLTKDFGDRGLLGYGVLIIMIAVYSAAVGAAYV